MRLDKWLWCARFYKTRQLASTAISAGKVGVNRGRSRPARKITVGDRLVIDKKGRYFEVDVLGMSEQRLSAPLAVQLYSETAESIERHQQQLKIRQLDQLSRVQVDRQKPNKHDRRVMEKFKRGPMS